jgi:pyruvate dehydrogenase E2 component (dihydrolipoamide acetyltransferase)
VSVEPLSRMRRAIVKAMSASAAIPQFSIEMGLGIARLRAVREQVPADRRPSYVDALVASVARALRDHPSVNASFTDDGIVRHAQRNVALAIALDDGLVSPAIGQADALGIEALAAERRRLTAAAKAGALTPEEVLSATFTISNLGPLGVRRFQALVVPPQAAILAVGGVEQDAMALTLSADHRVLDGAPAALFLGQVRAQLESDVWLQDVFAGLATSRPAPR